MKKRILSLLFAVVLIFGSICTPFLASAADEDTTDYLLEEMKTNMPEFDPAKYVASSEGAPMIIGSTIYDSYHEQLGGYQGTTFSLYIFNPRQLDIVSALVDLYVNCYNSSKDFDLVAPEKLRFYRDDYSRDKLFYKLTIDLSSFLLNASYTPGDYTLLALVDSTELSYKNGNTTKTWTLDQSFQSVFQPQAEGGYNVKTRSTDLEQLDVKLTSYKIGTVNADLTRQYEIFSAYFAIPEDYIKYYENLYSVTANFVRKHTTPIFWGNNPSLYTDYFLTDKANFISKDFDVSLSENTFFTVFSNTLININPDKFLETNNYAKGPFYWWFYHKDGAEGEISREQIEEYIDVYKNVFDVTLFDSSENVTMTHTIDESFDTSSYFSSADYVDFWRDFGAEYALLYWLCDNPDIFNYGLGLGIFGDMQGWGEKIAEYVRSQIDIPSYYKDYLNDEPHLVVFDKEEQAKALSLTDDELSHKYLVAMKDVDEFRAYLSSNPYTVLFRYDVGESYTDSLVKVEKIGDPIITLDPDKAKEAIITDGYSYGIMTTNVYFDFDVIDITFKFDDEYLSVATKSEKKNYIPSITVTPPPVVPPLNNNLFDDIFDGYKNLFSDGTVKNDVSSFLNTLGEKLGNAMADLTEILGNGILGTIRGFGERMFGAAWGVVKPVLIIIGLALVIFLLWWVIKSVTGKNFFDILFMGKSIGQKTAELAIRSSDSENRRREADQNAKLREQELALKATDQANRKAEADADAKARKRDQYMKVQENIAKREKDEREAKLKERESDRYERELKIREAEEKRRARDDRRRQKEIREKDKADKKAKEEANIARYNDFSVYDALQRNLGNTYGDNLAKKGVDKMKDRDERDARNLAIAAKEHALKLSLNDSKKDKK